jgi:acetoacetyl-CoA synthetase
MTHPQISDFINLVNKDYNYFDLYQWSIEHPEDFWQKLSEFCHVKFSKPYQKILQTGSRMIDARWFLGAELNFAEHLLRHKNNQRALVSYDESGKRAEYTYLELYQQVAKCAEGLKKLGIKQGDVVAGIMPNIPETIIAMLATTSMGAIWTACSPDFGASGIRDRLLQVSPKIIIAVEHYIFKGKTISCVDSVNALGVQTIWVPKTWDKLLDNTAQDINFVQLPFDHPVYILYSSGTTGAPKCIVHGAGGTLLQHLKELVLHTDLRDTDTLFYYTTCGWMMWHWMTSSLAVGATLLLYEGAPLYPEPSHLWDVIVKEHVSVFGTSAKYISALDKAEFYPNQHDDLTRLRLILSTGSPLLAQEYDYLYRAIKKDLHISSISGGTDIISCFALGCPILPVYPGELQCIGLGMSVKIFNERGQAIMDEKGELVCTAPFPSMPIYFWNDPDNARYLHSYFDKFPDVWAHGDFAKITIHGGLVIYGRSDAVLKPAGVRIGTAEIYRPVEKIPEVLECLAIGQPWQDDIRIILFVVLRDGIILNDVLRQKIGGRIRHDASPRHVPAQIVQVSDLPRTINNKLSELAVKQVVMGEKVENYTALANPECLAEFARWGERNRSS